MSEKREEDETAKDVKRTRVQIGICAVLLGLCVGFFAGMSESPITATVIPLLFGLITGGVGLSLTKTDFDKPADRRRLQLAATTISLFSTACVVATVYGVSIRSGSSLASFVPNTSAEVDYPVALPNELRRNFDTVATALMIRRRLEFLGATPSETKLVLERLGTLQRGREDVDSQLLSIQKALGDALQQATKAESSSRRRDGQQLSPDSFVEITLALRSLQLKVTNWAKSIDAGRDISPEDVRSAASSYDEGVGELATDPDGRASMRRRLEGSPISVSAIVAVHEQLRMLQDSMEYIGKIGDVVEQMDKVIELQTSDGDVRVPTLTRRPSVKK